jgi:putative transposase
MLKKFGQFKSLLFPQFKENPVTGTDIALPKLGLIPINLHRPIPSEFAVKQVRIFNKADIWYASINIQCDVSVPNPMPQGHPIGVDVGLSKFLATSDGVVIKSPKFLKVMHRKLKLLQRRLSRKQKRSKNYSKQRIKVARLHHTIRDVASSQVIRNRGIALISTDGQSGIQNAYAGDLPGTEIPQSKSKI